MWFPKVIVPDQALGSAGALSAWTGVTVGASAKTVLPAGIMMVLCDAHTSIEVTTDGGTTFKTIVAASGAGTVISDGTNVYVVGDVTGGTADYTGIN